MTGPYVVRSIETPIVRIAFSLVAGFVSTIAPATMIAQASTSESPGTPARVIDFALEVGAVAATPFVEDGNGVTVRAGAGAFLGGLAATPISDRFALVGGLRVSASALRIESSGRTWQAGTTWQTDVRLGAEANVARRMHVTASAILARIAGDGDIVPFRDAGGSVWSWGGELAGRAPLPGQTRFTLFAAVGAGRVAGQPRAEPPLDAGWVGHARLGVRHALR